MALERAGYCEIELMPATKVLTPDYLMQQIRTFNQLTVRLYNSISRVMPKGLRGKPIAVNIGEIMAFARSGD